MANPLIFSIIIRGMGNIELPHKLVDVGKGSFYKKVKMIGHEYITVENNLIDV
ncbi:MAG TPA: hypothetical protein VFD10_07665 [Atribacterota bacterium]|nr:hypothetical protein [Atribacterota bacterium]